MGLCLEYECISDSAKVQNSLRSLRRKMASSSVLTAQTEVPQVPQGEQVDLADHVTGLHQKHLHNAFALTACSYYNMQYYAIVAGLRN